MTIRLNTGTFIRHAEDESMVWCPRTGGCTVMRNAQPIIEDITREWRSVDEIVRAVATKFKCGVVDVREGVEAVVGELMGQRFVEVKTSDATVRVPPDAARPESAPYQDENWTPLGDFYMRHGLPSELHIDLTDRCNEHCVHCYIPRSAGKLIDERIFRKVTTEFREAQGITVLVSGGECLRYMFPAVNACCIPGSSIS